MRLISLSPEGVLAALATAASECRTGRDSKNGNDVFHLDLADLAAGDPDFGDRRKLDAVPVSYTHLDVYKRQLDLLRQLLLIASRSLGDQQCIAPGDRSRTLRHLPAVEAAMVFVNIIASMVEQQRMRQRRLPQRKHLAVPGAEQIPTLSLIHI